MLWGAWSWLCYSRHVLGKKCINFWHHVSKESIITCYIENRNSKHIHFVDGADGGYTEAAKAFKAKLNYLRLAGNA